MPRFRQQEVEAKGVTPVEEGTRVTPTVGPRAFVRDLGAVAVGAIPDLADSVLASTSNFTPLDFERGTITKRIPIANENLQAAEAASGALGLIGATIVAPEVTALRTFDAAVKGNRVLRAISASNAQVSRALSQVRRLDKAAAETGLRGRDALKASINVAGTAVKRNAFANRARITAAKRTLTQGVATEALIAATLHENELAFPSEAGAATLGVLAGLGIIVPTAFDQIAVGASMRRALQTEEITRTRALALDAESGVDAIKESSSQRAFLKARSGEAKPKLEQEFKFSGRFTDEAALEAVQLKARRQGVTTNADLAISRDKESQVNLTNAIENLTVATNRGINGVEDSGFTMKGAASPEQQSVLDLTLNDGVALQGIEEIGQIPKGFAIEDVLKQREDFLNQREASALADLVSDRAPQEVKERANRVLAQINEARKLVPTVIDEAEILPASHFMNRGPVWDRQVAIEFDASKSVRDRTKKERTIFMAPETGIKLRGLDGKVTLPRGKQSIADLDFRETQSLYGLGRRFIQEAAEGRTFSVDSNASFFHLDIAETLLRERPHGVNVKFPEGMTRESAQVESFAQKVAAIRKLKDVAEEDLPTLRRKLNLPGLTEVQRTELGLEGTTAAETLAFSSLTPAQIRKSSLSDLKKVAAQARRKEGTLAAVGPEEADLLGNSLREGFSPFVRSGNIATAPVVAFRRPLGSSILDKAAIANRRVESLASDFAVLTNPSTSSGSISTISSQLLRDFDSQLILDLSKLDDTTVTASVGNTRFRRGNLSQQDFAAAGNQTILAAQRTFRKASSFFEKDFDAFIQNTTIGSKSIRDNLGDILKADSARSRLLVDQFTEARRGFQLDGKLKQAEDGKFEFVLRDTAENRRQYELVTGRPMQSGATLPLLNGAPLGVDETALGVINSFDAIANKLRADANAILQSAGLPKIRQEPFYIPPEGGKFQAFIFDANNVPVRRIVASSPDQLEELIRRQRNDRSSFFNKMQGGKIKKQGEIQQESSLLQRALNDFLDPSIPFVQAAEGRIRTGAGASPFATGRTVTEVLKDFKGISDSNARNLLEILFKPQLDEARIRASGAALAEKAIREGANRQTASTPSVANTFVSALLGRRLIDSPASTVGKIVGPIEAALDIGVRGGYSIWTSLGGRRLTQGAHRKQFEKAVTELKDRTPFENAHRLLEEQELFNPPPDVAAVVGKLNSLATRLILRYDTAHAVINLAGTATTFPVVARNLLPRAGDTLEDVAARFGRTADIFGDPQTGKVFTAWSVEKEMANSMKFMFNPKSSPVWEEAQRVGHLDAAVAEVYRELGRVHNTATWRVMARKLDKIASTVTDKSEEMAVAWSYFTAERLLQRVGITDQATRLSMARQMTDQAIANFTPLNRPQIFQSPGVGSALGLFQTYMFNYYGRLFGYIENRQTKLLAIQAATQSLMFGLNAVPGAKQYSDLVGRFSTGEQDPFDGIYNRFSQPVADALFYGIPSTLPLMFGADRQSAPSLSSRGDVDPRIPGSTQLPAGLGAVKTIFDGIASGIQLFRRDNPGITDQQVGEVLQRHTMNRPLSAVISRFWTDVIVDGNGNKVADETHTALGTIWRLMGFRTIQQTAEIQGNVRFRGAEAMRLERRARLNRDIKALIRGGDIDDKRLTKAFRTFLETGGTPGEFVGFLERNVEAATQTETARALDRQLANLDKFDSRAANIIRLYNATHDVNAQENTAPE